MAEMRVAGSNAPPRHQPTLAKSSQSNFANQLMSNRRVGLWLIGAFGGVGSIGCAWPGSASPRPDRPHRPGHRHSRRSKVSTSMTSMISSLAATTFASLIFVKPSANCTSGPTSLSHRSSSRVCPILEQWTANVRPGTVLNAGPINPQTRDLPEAQRAENAAECHRAHPGRPAAFRDRNGSTRSSWSTSPRPSRLAELPRSTPAPSNCSSGSGVAPARHLPASALYAWAALDLGWPYINFTPSLGASFPAAEQLAQATQGGLRRQGRQDRRDADEVGARPDVRPPQPQDPELGRPQHLRQPRRPGPRRPGQQGVEDPDQGPGHLRRSSATSRRRTCPSSTSNRWTTGRRPGTTSTSRASSARR